VSAATTAATVRPQHPADPGLGGTGRTLDPARQQTEESSLEGAVEDGIDDWIEDAG